MRTQGIFYSGSGTVYDCELDRCPKCNGLMRVAYTSKYKTVQSMSEVAMIAQRTKRCVNPGCDVSPRIWGSIKWGQIAPVSCTYGYDVIAQIGWQRQSMQQPFAAIHTDLRRRLSISEFSSESVVSLSIFAFIGVSRTRATEPTKNSSRPSGAFIEFRWAGSRGR